MYRKNTVYIGFSTISGAHWGAAGATLRIQGVSCRGEVMGSGLREERLARWIREVHSLDQRSEGSLYVDVRWEDTQVLF